MLHGPASPATTHQESRMYRNILVPTDGSDITGKAVQTALSLAKTVEIGRAHV